MDFTHDVLLHPFADAAVLGTHEQSVFYQTAKLRAFLVHDTEYLVLKEKSMSVEYSTFGEILMYFIRLQLLGDYGGGVGGVIRPCPSCHFQKEKPCRE